jgi:hypothetical protein
VDKQQEGHNNEEQDRAYVPNRSLPRLLTGDRLKGIFAAKPSSECVPEVHGKRIEIAAQGIELFITGSKRPCCLLQSVFDLLSASRPRWNGVQLAAELNLLCRLLLGSCGGWDENAHLISCVRIYDGCGLNQLRTHVIACIQRLC